MIDMIVERTETQIIRKSHPLWKVIDEMCLRVVQELS